MQTTTTTPKKRRKGMGEVLHRIGKSPMAVAGLCAAFWDSVVPGTPEERGLVTTSK